MCECTACDQQLDRIYAKNRLSIVVDDAEDVEFDEKLLCKVRYTSHDDELIVLSFQQHSNFIPVFFQFNMKIERIGAQVKLYQHVELSNRALCMCLFRYGEVNIRATPSRQPALTCLATLT